MRRISDRARKLRPKFPGRAILLVAAAAALAGIVLAGSAGAKPTTKWYRADIPAGQPPLPAGEPGHVTVTITNCGGSSNPCSNKASTQYLGSASIEFPSGFTVDGAASFTTPGDKAWSVLSASGSTIIIGNSGPSTTNALAPGESVGVTVSVTAPSTACGSQDVVTEAKQSNDFNGSGNGLSNVAPDPSFVVSGALDHFDWTTQPDPSQTAGVVFQPNSPSKITVTAYSRCNGVDSVKTDYTGANAEFSGLGNPGSHEPSYGFRWVDGVATSSGVIDYKAETTHLTVTDTQISADSDPFTVAAAPPFSATFTQLPSDVQVSTPFKVQVKARDQYGNLAGDYPLTLASTAPLSGNSATATDASGVATFGALTIDSTGTYTLDAKYGSSVIGTSAPVTVHLVLATCDPSQTSCSLEQQTVGSGSNQTSVDATVSGTGGYKTFAFDTFTLGTVPDGCAHFQSVGAAGVVLDVRPFTNGDLVVTYGIPLKLIQKSPNNGNKFIPICAGSARVSEPTCTDGQEGWMGRQLDQYGVPTGQLAPSICKDGLFWGILGTYQDAPAIDPDLNPTVTAWSGNSKYRYFTIRVPHPWDYQMRG